jgi:hypothetical protein
MDVQGPPAPAQRWDIRGSWFGVVVGAALWIGELRVAEMIP